MSWKVIVAAQRTSWAPSARLDPVTGTAARLGAIVLQANVHVVALVRHPDGQEAVATGRALACRMKAAASGIVVGMSAATPRGTEIACQQAELAVTLAHCCPRVPTTLADCPSELALLRDPAALAYATERLGSLADSPELLATLEAYYLHNGDRRTAARALAVHIRTLDYRIRRAEELTGLSARRTYDSRLIVAGLTARRSQQAQNGSSPKSEVRCDATVRRREVLRSREPRSESNSQNGG